LYFGMASAVGVVVPMLGDPIAETTNPLPRIVAVDPSVIPYGTRLYIVSTDGKRVYGEAVAGDTGGAMLSGKVLVDLFYENESDCYAFGRREVNVYILD